MPSYLANDAHVGGGPASFLVEFEKSIESPMESLMHMQEISQQQVFNFVYSSFVETFTKYKANFNFIHSASSNERNLTFFISAKEKPI